MLPTINLRFYLINQIYKKFLQLNVLREKANQYINDMVNFEDEKNRNKTLRQQLASLKAQKEEIEVEANKRTIRLNKVRNYFYYHLVL